MRNVKQLPSTKSGVIRFAIVTFFGLALLCSSQSNRLATIARAQSERQVERSELAHAGTCGVGTLVGRWGSVATAQVIPGGFAPAACVGVVTFDANGKFIDDEIHTFNGLVIPLHHVGTFKVNDDCTGEMIFIADDGSVEETYKFVIVDGGKEVLFIVPEQGIVSTGVLKRM